MHSRPLLGTLEWFELAFFIVLSGGLLTLVIRCWQRGATGAPKRVPPPALREWQSVPEVQLLVIGLPLELLWEIAQFPLYTVWHEGNWGYILYGLAHCTLGDLIILLAAFWSVSLLNRTRHWFLTAITPNAILFTLLGLAYTAYSEILNVRVKGTWDYTELMPMVPVINIGGMPFLQWLLIPPVLLVLMRFFSLALTTGNHSPGN